MLKLDCQPVVRGQHVARGGIYKIKRISTASTENTGQNAEVVLELYELLVDGDIHHITIHLRNVPQIAKP